jgi:hypothetical protein
MPVHDWTRVDAGLFHAFHQWWICSLCDALNLRGLPSDFYAIPEQNVDPAVSKDLGLPRLMRHDEANLYAAKADRVSVRHKHGGVVGVIEIVSPGDKGSKAQFKAFVEKSAGLIRQKVHLLVVDLFPPGKRDPRDVHNAIWEEFEEGDVQLPPEKPLVLASLPRQPRSRGFPRSGIGPAVHGGSERPLLRPGGRFTGVLAVRL